ncbi:FAD-dependent oxidoreductase [Halarchaeum nitratireducens]|uniref:Thioredoxin reductase n=1 Tax=Halarchaeum nitratireducens TaxID=489913 RepID=A0A830GD03_9EURY|nr:FAD-dependent oxidoreductase [Halarchaeum nitratireducens]GGN22830.1 thioredoxin reductase [Halarchaeum nitratireducens]
MGNGTESSVDVAVVGCGPAGCAAALCTARDGLDTVVFDGGDASIERCAYVETYPGFPAGIDVPTLRALLRAHVETADARLVRERVADVTDSEGGFRIETAAGRTVASERVVAATPLDADYLRGLDDEVAMFSTHVRETGTHQRFDGTYADADGRTPIDGLSVAGGLAGRGDQVLLAAADGMRVGRRLVHEARREFGYWEAALPHKDWLRRIPDADDDWEEERDWDEWFDYHRLPDGEHGMDAERVERVRERELTLVAAARLDDAAIEARTKRGQRRLAAHLDDEALLATLDDDVIDVYARERGLGAIE